MTWKERLQREEEGIQIIMNKERKKEKKKEREKGRKKDNYNILQYLSKDRNRR